MSETSPHNDNRRRFCPRTGRPLPGDDDAPGSRWLFPLVGLGALLWFLVRVIPKPDRARYPCQRVAAPLALSFLGWLGGVLVSALALRRILRGLRRHAGAVFFLAAMAALAGGVLVAGVVLPGGLAAAEDEEFEPIEGANSPMGRGRGIHPGRVVWVHDPEATSWDGRTGHWWSEENLERRAVGKMLSASLRRLTGTDGDAAAWRALFRHHNKAAGRGERGYRKGEKLVIKVNLNTSAGHRWGNGANTSPQMIHALLGQLVNVAGVAQGDITVGDPSRLVGDPIYDTCHGDFPDVRYLDRTGEKGRVRAKPDAKAAVHYADPSVQDSGKTYLPCSVTEADYMINLALLKGHDLAGVTFNAKNHFGSVWRRRDRGSWNAGWSPGNMHAAVCVHKWQKCPAREMGSYNPLVELMGHEQLGGKTMLYVIEGLYAAPRQGGQPARWKSAPFRGDWTSSLFASQDPVAIESVAVDFCRSEPTLRRSVRGDVDNYLHEAARADSPPSKVKYDPEGDGTRLKSLGVHEHWNNPRDRRYSRDMGKKRGIELVRVRQGK